MLSPRGIDIPLQQAPAQPTPDKLLCTAQRLPKRNQLFIGVPMQPAVVVPWALA